jgi:hypothetical protein
VDNRTKKKLPRWLCTAAGNGHVGNLRKALALGADPDARYEGATALYLAAVQGEYRCASLLLREERGSSPLDWARGWDEDVAAHRAVEDLLTAALSAR